MDVGGRQCTFASWLRRCIHHTLLGTYISSRWATEIICLHFVVNWHTAVKMLKINVASVVENF